MKPILLSLVGVLTLGGAALADDAAPVAPTFTITLTAAELQAIATALQDQPFKLVAPLLEKLNKQYQAQLPKGQPEPATEPPKAK